MHFRRWHEPLALSLLAAERQPPATGIRYAQAAAWQSLPQADSSAETRVQGAMLLRCSGQGVRAQPADGVAPAS